MWFVPLIGLVLNLNLRVFILLVLIECLFLLTIHPVIEILVEFFEFFFILMWFVQVIGLVWNGTPFFGNWVVLSIQLIPLFANWHVLSIRLIPLFGSWNVLSTRLIPSFGNWVVLHE